ncbi:MAG: ABC transporter substrate-binding protein [Nodularia sp. CChRGM 3473]
MGEIHTIDSTGKEIILPRPAERIVCLTATAIDILFELGMEPVGYLREGIASKPEFYGERAEQFVSVGSWMVPNISAIRKAQPDLVIGWRFPHRFYRSLWREQTPIYLMSGSGYDAALQRLYDIAHLSDRILAAEKAIAKLQEQIAAYHVALVNEKQKTVLLMGGSNLNLLTCKFIVETDVGTIGSVIKNFTHYPWCNHSANKNSEFIDISLKNILEVDPDIIFVQTYPPIKAPLSQHLLKNSRWRQLQAVKNNQVYEVEQFWHHGNGTRIISLMLDQLMSIIYPHLFRKTV